MKRLAFLFLSVLPTMLLAQHYPLYIGMNMNAGLASARIHSGDCHGFGIGWVVHVGLQGTKMLTQHLGVTGGLEYYKQSYYECLRPVNPNYTPDVSNYYQKLTYLNLPVGARLSTKAGKAFGFLDAFLGPSVPIAANGDFFRYEIGKAFFF